MGGLTIILSHLRHQIGRSVAMGAGVLAAVVAFVILTGSVQTAQLTTKSTINANFRSSYDILVRPKGSQTPLESTAGVVRPNYLSGIYGGITIDQLRQIKAISGISVAAPIAMLGQILETVDVPVPITSATGQNGRQLFKFSSIQRSMRGLAKVPGGSGYTYITPDSLVDNHTVSEDKPNGPIETTADNKSTLVCPSRFPSPGGATDPAGPFAASRLYYPTCWSALSGLAGDGWSSLGRGKYGAVVEWSFPVLLAAIDPAAEAQIAGVDKAIDSGRYLTETDQPKAIALDGNLRQLQLPVLAASKTVVDEQSDITIERLPTAAADRIGTGLTEAQTNAMIAASSGPVVQKSTIGAQDAYNQFLTFLSENPGGRTIDNYWTASPVTYGKAPDGHLAPKPRTNPESIWQSQFMASGYVDVPPDSADTSYRTLTSHLGQQGAAADGTFRLPMLDLVGTYDTAKLPGFSALSALPLETYASPSVAGANQASKALLHNQDLAPDLNSAGYLQQPPLLLTTLSAASALTDPSAFDNTDPTAPISVIRIKVDGVTGSDAVSRERVRLVATAIQQATGLDVDITIGSSPTPTLVDLPATAHGAPALVVSENWVEKGVAVRLLHQVDRKSLVLFILILLVCSLVVANATSAAVRARRTELAVLSCLGWSRARLYRTILGEVVSIGVIAGVLAVAVAVPIGSLLNDELSWSRSLLALPAAVVLAALAGLVPAWRASRVDPIAAVHEQAMATRSSMRIRGIGGLAVVSLLRTPGRLILGMVALALGVSALTILLGIKAAFHGAVVGSLLGDAVDVQVHNADLVAAILMIALGLAAVGDILYLDIKEQAPRYAALQAAGWYEATIARLVLSQAAILAGLGSAVGGVLGVELTGLLTHRTPASTWWVALAIAVSATNATMIVSLLPATMLRRLSTARLLSSEV